MLLKRNFDSIHLQRELGKVQCCMNECAYTSNKEAGSHKEEFLLGHISSGFLQRRINVGNLRERLSPKEKFRRRLELL